MRSNNIFNGKYIKKEERILFLHKKRLGEEDLQKNKLFGESKHILLRKLKKNTSPICPECSNKASPIVYHCYDLGELKKHKTNTGILMFLLKCRSCGKLFLYVKDFKLSRRNK